MLYMRHSPRARVASISLAFGVIVLISACDDRRIRQLEVGMSKDSVIKIIGEGAPAGDTVPNIYRHNGYFVDGKKFDIYLFDVKNRKAWLDPEVTDNELTPIVVVDGKLEGTGWGYMDEIKKRYNISMRAGSAK
jgi:hypothetical protein